MAAPISSPCLEEMSTEQATFRILPPPAAPTLFEGHLAKLRAFYQSAPTEPTKGGLFYRRLLAAYYRHLKVAPDFAKIDVQGHELGALRGMERALAANAAVKVFFELSLAALRVAGTAPEALLGFFRERGFSLFATDQAQLLEITDDAAFLAKLPGRRYTNLLAARAESL